MSEAGFFDLEKERLESELRVNSELVEMYFSKIKGFCESHYGEYYLENLNLEGKIQDLQGIKSLANLAMKIGKDVSGNIISATRAHYTELLESYYGLNDICKDEYLKSSLNSLTNSIFSSMGKKNRRINSRSFKKSN